MSMSGPRIARRSRTRHRQDYAKDQRHEEQCVPANGGSKVVLFRGRTAYEHGVSAGPAELLAERLDERRIPPR